MIRSALPILLLSITLTACGTDEKPPQSAAVVQAVPESSTTKDPMVKTDTLVPPPPVKPAPMFTPPVIVDEVVSDVPPTADELNARGTRSDETQWGTDAVAGQVTVIPDMENDVFAFADPMPEFPGGKKAMMQFLAENLQYPQTAIEEGIQGKVYVNFTVMKDGTIDNVKALRRIGSGCDEEAIRVVRKMPKWKPGMIDGQPVNVKFNIPIVFQLQ